MKASQSVHKSEFYGYYKLEEGPIEEDSFQFSSDKSIQP